MTQANYTQNVHADVMPLNAEGFFFKKELGARYKCWIYHLQQHSENSFTQEFVQQDTSLQKNEFVHRQG
jgi:hypothetical protein